MDHELDMTIGSDTRLGSPDAAIVRPSATDPARLEAFLPSPCVQNHAANIMPLPDGDLACVWFGGTQEGIPDVSVYFSRLAAGGHDGRSRRSCPMTRRAPSRTRSCFPRRTAGSG